MNAIVPQNFGALSTRFAGQPVEDDLSAGVSSGFGHIGYKGKVWSIRHRGEERKLMREDGDGPRGSIEVVILKAAGVVSKIYYAGGFIDGSTEAPDCFSTNGVTPDASAKNKQHTVCATCPMNAWGSKLTEAGKNGKACSDSKRLAVVPAADIENKVFGGPMLLRVPAASLQDLATYGKTMRALGYPYYAVSTRIAFDPGQAYPKFVFKAIAPLSDAEADQVIAMQQDPQVERILAEGAGHVAAPAQDNTSKLVEAFEKPPVTPQVAQQATPKAAPPPPPPPKAQPMQSVAPAPKPAASAGGFGATAPLVNDAPAQQDESAGTGIDDLDKRLDALLGGAS